MQQCILHRATCKAARFDRTNLTYADFSHADLTSASFSGAVLTRANLHGIIDEKTVIDDRASALGIDEDLLAAERWRPSY